MIRAIFAALALAACAPPQADGDAAVPPGSLFAAAPEQQWRLPRRLAEISGLAAHPDGRVFTHDDEAGVIYEIDVTAGGLIKNFAMGDPIETGDFEGLAITPEGVFYLITSRGLLYRFEEGADGAQVAFETIDTGMHQVCEIEGLAYFAPEESLILACKRMNAQTMRDSVPLYAWRPGAPQTAAREWLALPAAQLAQRAGVAQFRPSSVEIDPISGRILLLSGNDGAFAELSREGEILAARALAGHAQAEGVTIAPDGTLIISDEAAGGQAMLSRYARAP